MVFRFGTCLLVLALAAVPLFGQSGIGKITGVITDPSGAAVTNVTVEARNEETGEARQAPSNDAGVYVISPLPAGVYTLRVRREGFRTAVRTGIHIDVNSAPSIDIQLEVGSATESVTVTEHANLLDADNGAISESRFAEQLEDLPVPVLEVSQIVGQVAAVPYSTQSTIGGTWEYNSGRSAVGVISDGALANPDQTEGWPSIGGINRRADLTLPGIDSIAEVELIPNGGDAQYMQPATVIISSKAGTNEFHGGAFEFYSSGGLGAIRWGTAALAGFVRHQFGANVGGPIKKNRMFFTFGLDGFRDSLNNVLNARYPTAAERDGNLSDYLQRTSTTGAAAPVVIYDPLTPGTPFPNNTIPSSRIDPISSYLLNLIPVGPTPVGGLTNYNAVYLKPEFDNSDKYDFRYDYNISNKDRLFARTTVAGLNQMVAYLGAVNGYYGYSGKHEHTEAIVGNWTRTISPTTVAVFEFAFRSMPFKADTSPEGSTIFPIPIVNINPKPPFAGPPSISIGSNALDISNLFQRKLFNYSADYDYSFDPTLTKVIHNHTLKDGVGFLRSYKTNQLAAPPYGSYTTASQFNTPSSTSSATGDAYADFLLGLPSTTDDTVGPYGAYFNQATWYLFIQDDWKVTPKLTVNLGLRYDHLGFMREWNEREATINWTNGDVVIPNNSQGLIQPAFMPFASQFETASQAGLPNNLFKSNNLDFAPRVGAAYRITPTMVIRGGFGIYHVATTLNQYGGMYNGPPFIYTANLSRSLLTSEGVNVNSLFTFENPTANGSTAAAASALAGLGGAVQNYPTEKAYEWNVTLEKDLGHDMKVTVSYLANLGRDMSRTVEINACVIGPTECVDRTATDPTGRKYPQYGMSSDDSAEDGQSEFNSGEVVFQKRFAHGFLFETSYAYSRLFTYENASDPVSNPLWKYDWGPVATNFLTGSAAVGQPTNLFHWNYVYELPIGKGRRFAPSMNWLGEAIVGGWEISGLGTWQSGDFLDALSGTGQSPTGATSLRANVIGNTALPAGTRQSTEEWFNTAAFAQPTLLNPSAPDPTYNFGTAGVGILHGPSFFAYDMTLFKSAQIHERLRVTARIDAFNPLNHPVLGDPDTTVTDANFGRILTSNANYNPRSFQLGAKLQF